ncbi:DNA helicase, partial [Methylobacterium goesingense]
MGETAEAPQAGMATAPDAACRIACDALARIGVPQLRAGLGPIRSLTLTCEAGADLPALVLALTAEPPLLRAEPLRIPGLEAGASRACCAPPAMILDEAALDALQAVTACVLTLVATVEGRPVGRATVSLDLLPATYWAGIETAPDALATFVRPGDPAIDALLARAAEHLPPGRDRLATYADGRARVWETAQAIHAALRDQTFAESAPVAGPERMRSPGAVLGDGWAGPLDRALILAACFERAGLDPLLVLGAATVAAGLRLVDARPAEAVDAQGLRKHRDLDELILIATGPAAFPEALAAGTRMVEAGAALDLVLDLRAARLRGLAPLTPEAA